MRPLILDNYGFERLNEKRWWGGKGTVLNKSAARVGCCHSSVDRFRLKPSRQGEGRGGFCVCPKRLRCSIGNRVNLTEKAFPWTPAEIQPLFPVLLILRAFPVTEFGFETESSSEGSILHPPSLLTAALDGSKPSSEAPAPQKSLISPQKSRYHPKNPWCHHLPSLESQISSWLLPGIPGYAQTSLQRGTGQPVQGRIWIASPAPFQRQVFLFLPLSFGLLWWNFMNIKTLAVCNKQNPLRANLTGTEGVLMDVLFQMLPSVWELASREKHN